MANYNDVFAKSVENPEEFWAEAAEGIDWYQKWDKVLDDSNHPFYKWFTGGRTNIVANAIDRHLDSETKNKLALMR